MINFIKNLFGGKKEVLKEEPKALIEERKTEIKKEPIRIPTVMPEEEMSHGCSGGGCGSGCSCGH